MVLTMQLTPGQTIYIKPGSFPYWHGSGTVQKIVGSDIYFRPSHADTLPHARDTWVCQATELEPQQ